MCLDIDPSSVIHKHLVKKINDLDRVIDWRNEGHIHNQVTKYKQNKEERHDWVTTKHDLTILPSFHISLGKPPSKNMEETHKPLISSVNSRSRSATPQEYTPLIGEIALAPINISKQNNKKSAWIPLNTEWLSYVIGLYHDINLNQFKCYDVPLGKCTKKQLHISLANLTGNPHDSVARPEDCIIDTITS